MYSMKREQNSFWEESDYPLSNDFVVDLNTESEIDVDDNDSCSNWHIANSYSSFKSHSNEKKRNIRYFLNNLFKPFRF